MSSARRVFVGVDLPFVADIRDAIDAATADKFDFIAAPLFHPRFRRGDALAAERPGPGTRSDMVLSSAQWSSCVVGRVSPWIAVDSLDASVAHASEVALKQELAWATHLTVPAALLPAMGPRNASLARCISQVLVQAPSIKVWVTVPLTCGEGDGDSWKARGSRHAGLCLVSHGYAQWWSRLHSLCEWHPSMGVTLEMSGDVPPDGTIERWLAEPVKAAILPTSLFLSNDKHFPVLTRHHQQLVKTLISRDVQLLIRGRPRHRAATTLLPYLQYVAHLAAQLPPVTPDEAFERPYFDYLQAPLQPLMDNLESQTYETFERDPVKYARYEDAVHAALVDFPEDRVPVVMVVGAGRGPLVRAVLNAASRAGRGVRVYAVEKNPNAIITLRNRALTESWGDVVTVVPHDMRTWRAPEQADVLVSELLGSFGDNELSPECLDGAQRFLRPGGISIPSDYTSFLAPVMSSKLWSAVQAFGDLKHFETPYVVKPRVHLQLADSQPCFKFSHPSCIPTPDNNRHIQLSFVVQQDAVVHGLLGYFETTLYGACSLSINPPTFSEGMFSWFPVFFPLRQALHVSAGQHVVVHMWRVVSAAKVWYEWAVVAPHQTAIHNPAGRSYWIGL